MSGLLKDATQALSEFADPFHSSRVTSFLARASFFMKTWHYHGSIEFTNGKTSGQQKFHADSYAALLAKMTKFLNELEASEVGE